MSRVISDSQQTIVRASQLGDVIVSVKRPTISSVPLFTVILNLDVATVAITFGINGLTCTPTHTLQNFNHNESPNITSATLVTPDGDITVFVLDGSFPLETTPSHTLVTTPNQENLLSNVGSFTALDAIPFVDVT